MKFIISGKNIDVTPGLKDTITHKLGKLERYFTPDTEIIVTLSVEKERQKIEVTIPVKGQIIRSEQVSSDLTLLMDSGDFDWMMDSLMERVEAESAQLICVYVSPDGVPLLRLTMDTTGWFRFDPVE